MKKTSVILSFLFAAGIAYSQQSGDLKITVYDIDAPGTGQMILSIYEDEEAFPRETKLAVKSAVVQDIGETVQYTFTDVPVGTYAVAVFLDQNRNGEIDSNFIGIPKEPIGASNHTKLGKPSFEKCSFKLTPGGTAVRIKLLND